MKNIIIAILAILLIAGTGYLVYDNIYLEKDESTTNETSNDKNNIEVSKLDENKAWIYDADYKLSTDKESYCGYDTQDCNKLIKANELIVPYINIESSDAKKVNQEIYKLYEELIDKFNKNLDLEIYFTTVKYQTYYNNDIVSVVITTESAGTGVPQYDYYTYNFNLKDGSLLSYEDIYKSIGHNKDNINNRVEQIIKNTMEDLLGNYDGGYPDGTSYESHVSDSINNYNNSVTNKEIKYYIDKNNKLNILVYLAMDDIVDGDHETILTIE